MDHNISQLQIFTHNTHNFLLPPQLLFQAIRIYTVSRCTYRNYQNLPGIVKDAIVSNNYTKSVTTLIKSNNHDKLPDVRAGTLH